MERVLFLYLTWLRQSAKKKKANKTRRSKMQRANPLFETRASNGVIPYKTGVNACPYRIRFDTLEG